MTLRQPRFRPQTPHSRFNDTLHLEPPPVARIYGEVRGISALRHSGASIDPAVTVQEVLVPANDDDLVILFLPSATGVKELHVDGAPRARALLADSAYLFPPGTERRWICSGDIGDMVNVYLSTQFLDSPALGIGAWRGPVRTIDGGGEFGDLFQALIADAESGRLSRLALESYGVLFALRLGSGPEAAPPRRGGLAGWQVKRTTEFLSAHLGADVSLARLAEIAGLSTYHFARAFRQSTGIPPHRYQLRLRVERAKALLRDSGLSIGDIAAQVGYETPQILTRLFRKEVGVTPSRYRRLNRD